MYLWLTMFLLQFPVGTPQLFPAQTTTISKGSAQQLVLPKGPPTSTTGTLSFDSGINIGFQLGTQGETLGELRARVGQLEEQRQTKDRPDIDDLQQSRTHAEWTVSILVAVLTPVIGILAYFRKFFWRQLRIFLQREIVTLGI